MNPLVTISIPLFKCEEFLEKCLDSVRFQTYKNFEVILVNDQTPDNSVKIAENFIQKYQLQNWKIIHLEKNSGLSVVRNRGIDEAKGKYLFFQDSDDTITPECIEKMVEIAEKKQLEMVVGEVLSINLETGAESFSFPIKTKEDFFFDNETIFREFVKGNFAESSWNKLILTQFLRKNKLYFTPGLFAQDALQSFQTAMKLTSIGFLREVTYHYYLHKNSVIHNRNERHFNNWITIAQEIDKAYKNEKNPQKKALILEYLINFKTITLQMNWKAQKNEDLWKKSYSQYRSLKNMEMKDYLSKKFTRQLKKQDFFQTLPVNLGFKLFKWRYER